MPDGIILNILVGIASKVSAIVPLHVLTRIPAEIYLRGPIENPLAMSPEISSRIPSGLCLRIATDITTRTSPEITAGVSQAFSAERTPG